MATSVIKVVFSNNCFFLLFLEFVTVAKSTTLSPPSTISTTVNLTSSVVALDGK